MKNLKGGSVSIDMKANVNDQKEDVMQIHPYAADYLHKARTQGARAVSHRIRRPRWTLQGLRALFAHRDRTRTERLTSTPCPEPC